MSDEVKAPTEGVEIKADVSVSKDKGVNASGELKVGFLQSDVGTNSSGRLVKVLSFIMAGFISVGTILYVLIAMGGFVPQPIHGNANEIVGYTKYVLDQGFVSMVNGFFFGFLGLAGGTELVQKITKT